MGHPLRCEGGVVLGEEVGALHVVAAVRRDALRHDLGAIDACHAVRFLKLVLADP